MPTPSRPMPCLLEKTHPPPPRPVTGPHFPAGPSLTLTHSSEGSSLPSHCSTAVGSSFTYSSHQPQQF